jgi:hypothetical protein
MDDGPDPGARRPSVFSRPMRNRGYPICARLSLQPSDAHEAREGFDLLEPAEQLAENTRLYLLHCHRVLVVPLHAYPREEWPMWLRARDRAGRAMLTATLRVEERSLRRRELDVLPDLLRRIEELRETNPALDLSVGAVEHDEL